MINWRLSKNNCSILAVAVAVGECLATVPWGGSGIIAREEGGDPQVKGGNVEGKRLTLDEEETIHR